MPKNFSDVIGVLVFVLFLVVMIRIIVRLVRNKWGPVHTVKAVVVDKHKVESFSKYSGTGKRVRYVVVFSADGKRLPFYVSEFSYGGYRLKEKGTLKYQGDRIIDFN